MVTTEMILILSDSGKYFVKRLCHTHQNVWGVLSLAAVLDHPTESSGQVCHPEAKEGNTSLILFVR